MQLRILSLNDTCTGCGACVSVCPKNALQLSYNDEGFYYPHLQDNLCIDCKSCEKVCHVLKDDLADTPEREYKAVMLKAKSKDLIFKSSSGGAFSLLADSILKQGGVVYGARYNYEQERLEHISTDECDINELRKSKYIESFLGNIFFDVKKQLKSGRKVMFCGTPCQVKGLSIYLDNQKVPKDNLLLVRLICHGVPANKFFTDYKHYIENKVGAKMIHFDFRPKTQGWRKSNIVLNFSNGKVIDEPYYYNYYYYYYQLNYLLRSSCYNCKQILQNTGDITIGDFWGIHGYSPENSDQEGISLVLQNSQKGSDALAVISDKCNIEALPQSAVDYIYNDSKKDLFDKSKEMMTAVKEKGYMSVAKKVLSFKIWKLKTKTHIKILLKTMGIWQIIKLIRK